jgi:hypothetical protein
MPDNDIYRRNPRGPHNPDLRTPFEKLNEHYKAGPGLNRNLRTTTRDTEAKTTVRDPKAMTTARGLTPDYVQGLGVGGGPNAFRANPAAPDLMPGAVRRGSGDIWSRIREELRNIKQGFGTMGRGFAAAGSEVGQELQRLNLGPQGDKPWLTINDPFTREKSGVALAASHAPVVPTTEKGAPASTYDRGEGAPAGTTRLQQMVGAGAPASSMRQIPGRNKYLDMYYAGAAAQQKFLRGLPDEQAPVEVIRGTERTFFSPTTKKEYGTPIEAAHGVEHAPEMVRQIEREAAEAKQQRFPFKAFKVTDPTTFEEKIKVVDPNTGKVLDDTSIDPDLQAVQARYPSFMQMSPEQQEQEMANMTTRQRKMLIQIIRQLAEEQGGK